MKIADALSELRNQPGKVISSDKVQMYAQTEHTIVYWLIMNESTDALKKMQLLNDILSFDDWTVDNDA